MTNVDAGRIVSSVVAGIGGVLNSLPKAQLAKVGLTRSSMASVVPVMGAFVGGALVATLAIPSSRKWVLTKSRSALETLIEFAKKDSSEADGGSNDVERMANAPSAGRDTSDQPS